MICTDCNGTGKYVPFTGPSEPCKKCGGAGQLAAASFTIDPATVVQGCYIKSPGAFDPNIVRVHLIQPASPFAADVGDWRWFDAKKPGKSIDTLGEFEGEFIGLRMLACDFRDKNNVVNVIYDDDPTEFNRLKDEATKHGAGSGMAVGPDIQIKVGLLDCWWHAYSKTNNHMVLQPTPCSPNGLFHPGYIGSRYRFKSKEINSKHGRWWTPEIERL